MKRRLNAGVCVFCGVYRETLHRDHIVPKFKGGSDDAENIQWLCANCHEDKSRAERTGVRLPPSIRENMRVAAIGRMAVPGARERISVTMTVKWQDPALRQKIREAKAARRRITPRGVQVIREMREAGHTQQYIADYLTIPREYVRDVIKRRHYAWVP